MSTENIIHYINNDDINSAKKETENVLYAKIQNHLESLTQDVNRWVYEDAIGVAGLVEKKKSYPDEDEEDDGDGLDPVGAEDSDVDNDGDSDESDDYLKNRRKAIGKSIKKKKNGDDEDEELDEAQYKSRAASRRLRGVETNPDLNRGPATHNTPSGKITPSAAARREQIAKARRGAGI